MAAAVPAAPGAAPEDEVSDLGPLAVAWDEFPILRQRVRTYGRILLEKPEDDKAPVATSQPLQKTVDNLKYNSEVMKPLLEAMAKYPKGIPAISALTENITEFFGKQGMTASPKVLSDQSWSFRHLFQVLKGLKKRQNPPRATCLHALLISTPFCTEHSFKLRVHFRT